VRAYATNSVGTAYGSVLSLKTSASTLLQDKAIKEVLLLTFSNQEIQGSFQENSWFNSQLRQTKVPGLNGVVQELQLAQVYLFWNWPEQYNIYSKWVLYSSIAARICNDLVSGGYSDWYLPSYYELQNCIVTEL
jgi:hypothetical protein